MLIDELRLERLRSFFLFGTIQVMGDGLFAGETSEFIVFRSKEGVDVFRVYANSVVLRDNNGIWQPGRICPRCPWLSFSTILIPSIPEQPMRWSLVLPYTVIRNGQAKATKIRCTFLPLNSPEHIPISELVYTDTALRYN